MFRRQKFGIFFASIMTRSVYQQGILRAGHAIKSWIY